MVVFTRILRMLFIQIQSVECTAGIKKLGLKKPIIRTHMEMYLWILKNQKKFFKIGLKKLAQLRDPMDFEDLYG
jgi:hypothetical protein